MQDLGPALDSLKTPKQGKANAALSQQYQTIGVGAQILRDLGVEKMKLLSSPLRFNALSGFNLEVVEYVTADPTSREIIEVAMAIRRIEGLLHLASEGRYAILVGRFNSFVVEHLLDGAIDTLKRHGVSEDNITVVHAPGAWEPPVVAKKLAASNGYDAIIALGAVIRGNTPTF